MHLQSFEVRNFRRLRDVTVELAADTTVFVGANNSGKTSAMHIFLLFTASAPRFTIHDFSAECWNDFNAFDPAAEATSLPTISLDLWFAVDEPNLHRVIDLLPDLDWEQSDPVGIRLCYEPRDALALYDNYLALKPAADATERQWPKGLYDYLRRNLSTEYQVSYYKLDHRDRAAVDHELHRLDNGRAILTRLIRVDALQAQRHLSDAEQRGGDEDLSKTLSRFYKRHLEQAGPHPEAARALVESERHLNEHFTKVFEPILEHLGKLGYPGVTDPTLTIRSELGGESLLKTGAQVHYVVPGEPVDIADGSAITLPDRYNGLGFKNLIYMVVEVLAAHRARLETADARPPVHLIMIEEPEAHLHVQLQQVFIKQLRSIVSGAGDEPGPQFVLTTHSSHIVYADFSSIRYFARVGEKDTFHYSDVRDLSTFYLGTPKETRAFLQQYLKLTHCDLFFADAAVLVEGNVERLLLPLLISRDCSRLENSHLTILELGGAFAHKFKELIEFLGLPCLIITDIDSVQKTAPKMKAKACLTDTPGAFTANQTLRQWIPKESLIKDLLELLPADKSAPGPQPVRVAYQTPAVVIWNEEPPRSVTGRTFEESFAFENLQWSQELTNKPYGLRVSEAARAEGLDTLIQAIFDRVRNLDKTRFALTLIERGGTWVCPSYIAEGLNWLADQLSQLETSALEPIEGAADESPAPQP